MDVRSDGRREELCGDAPLRSKSLGSPAPAMISEANEWIGAMLATTRGCGVSPAEAIAVKKMRDSKVRKDIFIEKTLQLMSFQKNIDRVY
jgi:hypothetical protein